MQKRSAILRPVQRPFKPGQKVFVPKGKQVLLPVMFPSESDSPTQTRLFLSRSTLERMRGDFDFINKVLNKTAIPASTDRLPSGLVIESEVPQGRRVIAGNHYASKSPFFLVGTSREKLEQTRRICQALGKKGIPTPEFVESFNGKKPGKALALFRNAGQTLYNIHVSPEGLKAAEYKGYLHALGTLHSLGISHEHSHWANFFKRSGKIGVFDFSKAELHKVNWKSVESIMTAFENDYKNSLSLMLYSAMHDKQLEKMVSEGKATGLARELSNPLPASPEVKERLAAMLAEKLYKEIIPYYKEHSFFKIYASKFERLPNITRG